MSSSNPSTSTFARQFKSIDIHVRSLEDEVTITRYRAVRDEALKFDSVGRRIAANKYALTDERFRRLKAAVDMLNSRTNIYLGEWANEYNIFVKPKHPETSHA